MYQSGYLMSARHPPSDPSQAPHNSTPPTGGDTPVIPTKAKMNHSVLARDPFGMDSSLLDSSRSSIGHGRRQQGNGQGMDEDAPPTRSVNDLEEEMFGKAGEGRTKQIPADSPFFARRFAPTSRPASTPTPASATPSTPTLYVVVFGYPPDKFDATAEYFKALCASSSYSRYSSTSYSSSQSNQYDDDEDNQHVNPPCTDAEPNAEVLNCFRIGYHDAGDAMRAVKKNGEVIGGSWMVGVKWADPNLAESLLGPSILSSNSFLTQSQSQDMDTSSSSPPPPNTSSFFGTSSFRSAPTPARSPPAEPNANNALVPIGTPMRLAPSSSAFRVGTPGTPAGGGKAPAPVFGTPGAFGTPQASEGQTQGQGQAGGKGQGQRQGQVSPNKGMLGQVSDLIFGW